MIRVIIELDDLHDNIMSITAIGTNKKYDEVERSTVVTSQTFNLEHGTYIIVDENGKWEQR